MKEQHKDPQTRRRNVQAALIVHSVAAGLITRKDAHALSASDALQTLTRSDLEMLARPVLKERTGRASEQMLIGAGWTSILRGNRESTNILSHVPPDLLNFCFNEYVAPLLRDRISEEGKTERITGWFIYAIEALITNDIASESSCAFAFGSRQELLGALTPAQIGELVLGREGTLDRLEYPRILQKYGLAHAVEKAGVRTLLELVLRNASELPLSRTSLPVQKPEIVGEDDDDDGLLPTVKPARIPGVDDLPQLPPQTPVPNADGTPPTPISREDGLRDEILACLERHGEPISGTARGMQALRRNPLHFTLLAIIGEHISAEGRKERLDELRRNTLTELAHVCHDILGVSERAYAADVRAILARAYPNRPVSP